jgi:hypothetical protein
VPPINGPAVFGLLTDYPITYDMVAAWRGTWLSALFLDTHSRTATLTVIT